MFVTRKKYDRLLERIDRLSDFVNRMSIASPNYAPPEMLVTVPVVDSTGKPVLDPNGVRITFTHTGKQHSPAQERAVGLSSFLTTLQRHLGVKVAYDATEAKLTVFTDE